MIGWRRQRKSHHTLGLGPLRSGWTVWAICKSSHSGRGVTWKRRDPLLNSNYQQSGYLAVFTSCHRTQLVSGHFFSNLKMLCVCQDIYNLICVWLAHRLLIYGDKNGCRVKWNAECVMKRRTKTLRGSPWYCITQNKRSVCGSAGDPCICTISLSGSRVVEMPFPIPFLPIIFALPD